MRNVLITGAAGFIGGQLAEHFREAGLNVFVDAERGQAAATRRWPLSEASLAAAMQGAVPDVVFHAAGSGTVAKVAMQPALELPANLSALLAVLQYVRMFASGAHVVLLSSAARYGEAPATPQAESDARPPVSLYGLAKAQAEQLAEYYAGHLGVRCTSVRLFSVYGPGLRKQLLWDAMCKFAAGQGEFFGTGQERRDWVHIADVCHFMDRLLQQAPSTAAYEVFNCAGAPGTTAEVLGALARAAGAGGIRFNGTARAGDPMCLVADCSKAERLLGWTPQVHWVEGVPAYAEWFRQQERELPLPSHPAPPGAARP